jgi:hypothetical protein
MMYDLVSDVATQVGPRWNDNRTHWRDIEGYDLAVGPLTGGRQYPKTNERPDKVRKLGQLTQQEVVRELFSSDEPEEDVFSSEVSSHESDEDSSDLNDIYGNNCYLAVYAYGRPKQEVDEWHDLLPIRIGMRKAVTIHTGMSVKECRGRKRRARHGFRKTCTTQDKRVCNLYI